MGLIRTANALLYLTLVMLSILYTTLLPNFYSVSLQHFRFKHAFAIRLENIVGPHQMTSSDRYEQ